MNNLVTGDETSYHASLYDTKKVFCQTNISLYLS